MRKKSEIQSAIKHWGYVAPMLQAPKSKAEYLQLIDTLDVVLDAGGADESHPLAQLAGYLGDLIETWENRRFPVPTSITGKEVLSYLMQQDQLMQSDLPDVATQSVISEILSGKRQLNVRQIAALAKRFGVSADLFVDK